MTDEQKVAAVTGTLLGQLYVGARVGLSHGRLEPTGTIAQHLIADEWYYIDWDRDYGLLRGPYTAGELELLGE